MCLFQHCCWGRFSKALQICLALLLQTSSASTAAAEIPPGARDPTKDCRSLSSSGPAPSPRGSSGPSLGTKCHSKNCCAVLLKLKLLPEFSVTNSRGDCRGVGECRQFLENIGGLKDNILQEGLPSHALDSLGLVLSAPLFLVTTNRVIQREFGAEMEPKRPVFRRSLGRRALPEQPPLVNLQL